MYQTCMCQIYVWDENKNGKGNHILWSTSFYWIFICTVSLQSKSRDRAFNTRICFGILCLWFEYPHVEKNSGLELLQPICLLEMGRSYSTKIWTPSDKPSLRWTSNLWIALFGWKCFQFVKNKCNVILNNVLNDE